MDWRGVPVALALSALALGCGEEDAAVNPDDEATKQHLLDARAALENAAAQLPGRKFDQYQKEVLRKEGFEPGRLGYYGLVFFLGESGENVPTIIQADPNDPNDVDVALSSIEFHEDVNSVTMVAPDRLADRPPSALLEAGVLFGSMSRSGQIFCLTGDAEEPEPCDPPPVEDLASESPASGASGVAGSGGTSDPTPKPLEKTPPRKGDSPAGLNEPPEDLPKAPWADPPSDPPN